MKLFTVLATFMFTLISTQAKAMETGEPGDGYAASWQLGLQEAVSPLLAEISNFHGLLMVIITVVTIFVTVLLLFIAFKFRRRKGVDAADFAHNTMIEVIWTIVPVVILIVIAIPSFNLLYFENRIPEPELTIKATGYQWYWGYEYTDYEGLNFLSYMIADEDIDRDAGQRRLLSTDEPVVVPVGANIQWLLTSADVIHAFALPASGVKKDAVPGQLNETWMRIDEPGIYFGQCSEICGTGHSYMPIEIHAVSKEEFKAWAAAKGGALKPKAMDETPEAVGDDTNAPQLEVKTDDNIKDKDVK